MNFTASLSVPFLMLTLQTGQAPAPRPVPRLPDGTVNLGAGLLNTFRNFKDVSAQRVYDAFWRMLPPEWNVREDTADGRVLSGPLPMGMSRTPPALPGMLVVGAYHRCMAEGRLLVEGHRGIVSFEAWVSPATRVFPVFHSFSGIMEGHRVQSTSLDQRAESLHGRRA